MSNTSDWLEGIANIGEESRQREQFRNEKLDKIITELETADPTWFMYYAEGYRISVCDFSLKSAAYDGNPASIEMAHLKRERQNLKRQIVEHRIIPAMHACIRAGFLQPKGDANG